MRSTKGHAAALVVNAEVGGAAPPLGLVFMVPEFDEGQFERAVTELGLHEEPVTMAPIRIALALREFDRAVE